MVLIRPYPLPRSPLASVFYKLRIYYLFVFQNVIYLKKCKNISSLRKEIKYWIKGECFREIILKVKYFIITIMDKEVGEIQNYDGIEVLF